MDGLYDMFISGGVAALLLELIKWVVRKWVLKQPDFDFHPNIYLVAIPVLNILLIPVAALLGVEGAVMPTDWISFVRSAVAILVQSLVTVFVYQGSIKPLKTYKEEILAKG